MGIGDWFKGTSTLDENSGDSFNYQEAQKKNERNRAIATMLMQNGQNFQGQIVSGHYVAPTNGLAALAKVASLVLGAKMQGDSDATDRAIKDEAQQAIDREMQGFIKKKNPDYQAPPTDVPGVASQAEKDDILKMFRPDEPAAAPAAPAAANPAPTASVAPAKKTAAAKALRAPAIDYSQVPNNIDTTTPQQVIKGPPTGGTVAERAASPAFGFGAGKYTPPVNAGGGRGMVNPPVVNPAAPVPVAKKQAAVDKLRGRPTAPVAPQAQPVAPVAPPVAPPTPQQSEADFLAAARAGAGKQVDGSQIQQLPEAPEYIPTTQQEQLRAISRISQMGQEGQFLSNHLYTQQFGKGQPEFAHATDGNGNLVIYNKSNPTQSMVMPVGGEKVLETKETPDGLFERTSNGWRQAKDQNGNPIRTKDGIKLDQDAVERNKSIESTMLTVNEANDRLTRVLSDVNIIKQAKGDVTNAVSGKLSQVMGVATDTSVARTKINDAVAAAVSAIIDMKRAGGMTASQMNSDADMRLIQRLAGEIQDNYGALDEATLKGKLVQLQDMVSKVGAAQRPSGQAPAPATPAKGGGLLSGRF